jgi:hypothetical protein
VAANDYIFAACGFDDIDDIGHAYYSWCLIQHGMVLQFEVFTFPECFIDWISFEHKR